MGKGAPSHRRARRMASPSGFVRQKRCALLSVGMTEALVGIWIVVGVSTVLVCESHRIRYRLEAIAVSSQ